MLWYHTIELEPGVVTPGWFDLRPILARMPWPDVRGKRCLDVGTWDGTLAFELERRGASEVVATDIADPAGWDWPRATRDDDARGFAAIAGQRTGTGFEIARRALGSAVVREQISVYELSPERLGRFDVVVCGSLMLHLRDPVGALEGIRSVTGERFLSAETVRLGLSLLRPRAPAAGFERGVNCRWWIPNVAGHRAMLAAAGFELAAATRPYAIPFGSGHPAYRSGSLRNDLLARLLAGGRGVPHAAVLAVPRGS